ncbi:ferritin family protein [Streptomyces sp. NPDC047987]|uniref:ferritin family protein n=1 Tax=unclassified Streptomyces TaxID=2593676 RepID=UPI00342BCA9B
MKGEAFAYASYSLFAAEADRQARPAVGKLYRSTARTELNEHLREAATLTGTIGSDAANLRQAINGETYEHQVMYRGFADQARKDGDPEAAKLFTEIASDEGRHRNAYRAALTVVTTGRGSIPAPPKADTVPVPAGLPKVKTARTMANLDTAMHGEALAHAKYMLFATRARQTGNPALARLFEGTAGVELHEHFAGEAALAGLVRTTKTNLRKAITGERNEATSLYRGSPSGPHPSATPVPPATSATPPPMRPGTQRSSSRHSTSCTDSSMSRGTGRKHGKNIRPVNGAWGRVTACFHISRSPERTASVSSASWFAP